MCSPVDGLEGQHDCLELDASHNRKPVELGVSWENLGRLQTRCAAVF